jgi:hypothetical protein
LTPPPEQGALAQMRSARTGPAQSLMEAVVEQENMRAAHREVLANKGSPGIDGMTVEELPDYIRKEWPRLRKELLEGRYRPQPVKRVEIPKPDGRVRELGVPTVVDRLVQPVRANPDPNLRPDFLPAQLRLPSRQERASGTLAGTGIRSRGVRVGGRPRLGPYGSTG